MPRTAFNTTVRPITAEQREWLEEVWKDMPPFGICFQEEEEFQGLPYLAEWNEDRAKDLSDYLIEKGAVKKCQFLAHTKDWNDYLGVGVTKICRLSCDQITEALNQPSWLKGTDLLDPEYYSEGVLGCEPPNTKYHIVGLFRLLFASQTKTFQGEISEKSETYPVSYYPHQDDFDPYSDSVYVSLKFGEYGGLGKGDCWQSEGKDLPNLARRKSPPKTKSPQKTTRPKAPKKSKPVLDEKVVREYIKTHFTLKQLEDLETHIACCRLSVQTDKVDEDVSEPEEEYECPSHPWVESDFEGKTIWENEDTAEIVFPCKDVKKAQKYRWNEDCTDIVKV